MRRAPESAPVRVMADYRIAVAARLTGLAPDTIRKWESRHHAVSPARDDKGLRRYSEADVRRLRDLRAATELGYPIGEAASLKPRALEQILSGDLFDRRPSRQRILARHADSIMLAVLAGLQNHDAEQIDRMLSAAAHLLTPVEFVFEVMSPIFRTIGESWRRGDMSVGQEHLFSAVARSVVGNHMRRFVPTADAPAAVFTTLPDDPHEFGILLAAMLAASQSWRVHYLGPNMSITATARTASETKAQVVVLGAASSRQVAKVIRAVDRIANALPAGVEIWFGGKGPANLMTGRLRGRVFARPTLQEFYERVRVT